MLELSHLGICPIRSVGMVAADGSGHASFFIVSPDIID
jgi:hypothetical protein